MRAVLAAVWMIAPIVLAFAPVANGEAHTDARRAMRVGTLTPEMVVGIRRVQQVQASPDGSRVVYVVSVPRSLADEPGEAYQEIWIANVKNGASRSFTPEKQNAWAPAFSPDGKRLAFLSNRPIAGESDKKEKTTHLFVLEVGGGEARLLSDGEKSVRSFRWSPSGATIAFAARDLETDVEKEDKKKGRDWKVADRNAKPIRLWALDVVSGDQWPVTTNDVTVREFDWSPEGTSLVVRMTESPRVDESYMYSSLALVPISGGRPVPFVYTQGKLAEPVFSPDGGFIAWLGATDLNDPFPGSVFVVSRSGGEAIELWPDSHGAATWVDWIDEKTLVVAATYGTSTVLELVPRNGEASRVLLEKGPVFTQASLARSTGLIALSGSTPLVPEEVFAGKLSQGGTKLRRLTTTNPKIEHVQLGKQEVVRWLAADSLEIEGILVRPLGFVSGKRYPLVVLVHGGPESCYRNGWVTSYGRWTQILANRGFMVLHPNYRGSIGRGRDFERGDHGDLAGREFEDVLAGIDHLARLGLVDPKRVGIGGGSYGGYLSAWAATAHSERFAAAIDFAGISNWLSMQGTSDIPEENALVHWNRPFYQHMDLYWERSPLSHVQKCQTPLLIAHGEKDARVPVGQATELYTALRLLGRDVEYVRYPRAGHGLKETAHQLDYLTRSLEWFETHLGLRQSAGISARR